MRLSIVKYEIWRKSMKVVDSGYKLDLHIHSYYSHGKDGAKVAFNTIDHT